jgi:hypothetical protein
VPANRVTYSRALFSSNIQACHAACLLISWRERHHHHHFHHQQHTSPPPAAAHTTSKSSSLILPSTSLPSTAAQTDPETLWKVVGDLGEGSFGMVHKVSIVDMRKQPTAW